MKRSNINRRAPKRVALETAARPLRLALVREVGRCEVCGKRRTEDRLAVHEILAGAFRVRCLTARFATLVVCQLVCHPIVQNESKPRQLARLYLSRPGDFDLNAVCKLWCRAPTAITVAEVMSEVDSILNRA
jgi:hypothetical protein